MKHDQGILNKPSKGKYSFHPAYGILLLALLITLDIDDDTGAISSISSAFQIRITNFHISISKLNI